MKQELIIKLDGDAFSIDPAREIDISIPVSFGQQQLQAFGAPAATAIPFSTESFAASVSSGAGYNCQVITFSAHLHGTHTECVGHISAQDYIVQDTVGYPGLMPAVLITVNPVPASASGEGYAVAFAQEDKVITRAALEAALQRQPGCEDLPALVIRTLPNDEGKKTQDHDHISPPFLTNDAMQYIAQTGFEHLLLDAPSVDRLKDEGKLSNHHIFWQVAQASNDVPIASQKSITELIFVPDNVVDGIYMLGLNIGNIRSDAAPSRPVLYELKPV